MDAGLATMTETDDQWKVLRGPVTRDQIIHAARKVADSYQLTAEITTASLRLTRDQVIVRPR